MTFAQVQPSNTGTAAFDLRRLLLTEHAHLEQLFEDLIAAFRAGDRQASAALWTTFENDFESHMALEEQLIFPEFAKLEPAEAAALTREHAAIRACLSELRPGVYLHCTNVDAVESFIRVLEEHAKREDALMYRWARRNLRQNVQAMIRSQLLGGVRRLLHLM